MEIIYDRHARRRMKWRRISQEEIEEVLSSPAKIEDTIRERKNAFKVVGKRYLKVTYHQFNDKILVISVVDKTAPKERGSK